MRRWYACALVVAVLALASGSGPTDVRAMPPVRAPQGACDLTGEWIGDGNDDNGTHWTLPLHVRQTGTTVDATIDWIGSNGHAGSESIRGTVDCARRTLEMQTVAVARPLVPGSYHVTLAPDFASMSGVWGGPGVSPGRFTARRR